MGLIDSLRNKMNQKTIDNNSTKNINYNVFTRSDGSEISLFEQKAKFQARHGNGEETNIVTAKIAISNPGDAIILDAGAPICFEIPKGMEIEEALRRGLLEKLEEQGFFNNLSYDKYNVLGRIIVRDNNVSITPLSDTVSAVEEQLNKELAQQIEQRQEKIKQQNMERQNKEAMQRQQDIQRRNQIREERKRNITFRYLGAKVKNGETLDSYETVDQNTGEEILISNVRKIGKDEQSNYLYTANMQLLEDMAYRMQDDLGYAVVFSTAYKLDQIEQMQDPQLIQKISKLLSVDNLSAEERVYLGQLNAQGEVTRKLEETSNSIQYNVKQMQQQYRNEHQRGGWEL